MKKVKKFGKAWKISTAIFSTCLVAGAGVGIYFGIFARDEKKGGDEPGQDEPIEIKGYTNAEKKALISAFKKSVGIGDGESIPKVGTSDYADYKLLEKLADSIPEIFYNAGISNVKDTKTNKSQLDKVITYLDANEEIIASYDITNFLTVEDYVKEFNEGSETTDISASLRVNFFDFLSETLETLNELVQVSIDTDLDISTNSMVEIYTNILGQILKDRISEDITVLYKKGNTFDVNDIIGSFADIEEDLDEKYISEVNSDNEKISTGSAFGEIYQTIEDAYTTQKIKEEIAAWKTTYADAFNADKTFKGIDGDIASQLQTILYGKTKTNEYIAITSGKKVESLEEYIQKLVKVRVDQKKIDLYRSTTFTSVASSVFPIDEEHTALTADEQKVVNAIKGLDELITSCIEIKNAYVLNKIAKTIEGMTESDGNILENIKGYLSVNEQTQEYKAVVECINENTSVSDNNKLLMLYIRKLVDLKMSGKLTGTTFKKAGLNGFDDLVTECSRIYYDYLINGAENSFGNIEKSLTDFVNVYYKGSSSSENMLTPELYIQLNSWFGAATRNYEEEFTNYEADFEAGIEELIAAIEGSATSLDVSAFLETQDEDFLSNLFIKFANQYEKDLNNYFGVANELFMSTFDVLETSVMKLLSNGFPNYKGAVSGLLTTFLHIENAGFDIANALDTTDMLETIDGVVSGEISIKELAEKISDKLYTNVTAMRYAVDKVTDADGNEIKYAVKITELVDKVDENGNVVINKATEKAEKVQEYSYYIIQNDSEKEAYERAEVADGAVTIKYNYITNAKLKKIVKELDETAVVEYYMVEDVLDEKGETSIFETKKYSDKKWNVVATNYVVKVREDLFADSRANVYVKDEEGNFVSANVEYALIDRTQAQLAAAFNDFLYPFRAIFGASYFAGLVDVEDVFYNIMKTVEKSPIYISKYINVINDVYNGIMATGEYIATYSEDEADYNISDYLADLYAGLLKDLDQERNALKGESDPAVIEGIIDENAFGANTAAAVSDGRFPLLILKALTAFIEGCGLYTEGVTETLTEDEFIADKKDLINLVGFTIKAIEQGQDIFTYLGHITEKDVNEVLVTEIPVGVEVTVSNGSKAGKKNVLFDSYTTEVDADEIAFYGVTNTSMNLTVEVEKVIPVGTNVNYIDHIADGVTTYDLTCTLKGKKYVITGVSADSINIISSTRKTAATSKRLSLEVQEVVVIPAGSKVGYVAEKDNAGELTGLYTISYKNAKGETFEKKNVPSATFAIKAKTTCAITRGEGYSAFTIPAGSEVSYKLDATTGKYTITYEFDGVEVKDVDEDKITSTTIDSVTKYTTNTVLTNIGVNVLSAKSPVKVSGYSGSEGSGEYIISFTDENGKEQSISNVKPNQLKNPEVGYYTETTVALQYGSGKIVKTVVKYALALSDVFGRIKNMSFYNEEDEFLEIDELLANLIPSSLGELLNSKLVSNIVEDTMGVSIEETVGGILEEMFPAYKIKAGVTVEVTKTGETYTITANDVTVTDVEASKLEKYATTNTEITDGVSTIDAGVEVVVSGGSKGTLTYKNEQGQIIEIDAGSDVETKLGEIKYRTTAGIEKISNQICMPVINPTNIPANSEVSYSYNSETETYIVMYTDIVSVEGVEAGKFTITDATNFKAITNVAVGKIPANAEVYYIPEEGKDTYTLSYIAGIYTGLNVSGDMLTDKDGSTAKTTQEIAMFNVLGLQNPVNSKYAIKGEGDKIYIYTWAAKYASYEAATASGVTDGYAQKIDILGLIESFDTTGTVSSMLDSFDITEIVGGYLESLSGIYSSTITNVTGLLFNQYLPYVFRDYVFDVNNFITVDPDEPATYVGAFLADIIVDGLNGEEVTGKIKTLIGMYLFFGLDELTSMTSGYIGELIGG